MNKNSTCTLNKPRDFPNNRRKTPTSRHDVISVIE